MATVPTFETSRLILRDISLADVVSYEKNFVDYEVISHLSASVPWPYPAGGVKSFFETVILPQQGKDRWFWGICLKEKPGEIIGGIDLWRDGKPENRGFWLGRNFWGRGYMTEAVQPVLDYAFSELGFSELTFANAVGNKRSRRIKEKTGARWVEVRPAQFVNPAYTEHEIWRLSAACWRNHKDSEK